MVIHHHVMVILASVGKFILWICNTRFWYQECLKVVLLRPVSHLLLAHWPSPPCQTISRNRFDFKKNKLKMTLFLFCPELFFQGRSTSWGSSQDSWANTWTSAPERTATRRRCLGCGVGTRTSLLIQHSGLPAVKLQPQAPSQLYAKASCGLLLPDWACHGQIKQTVDPF